MRSVRKLGFDHLKSMNEIVSQWLESEENRPLINWNQQKLSSSMENACVIGSENSEGEILGFLIYQDLQQSADIHLVISRINLTRQGAAQGLIDYLKNLFPQIALEVHERNEKAINFYRKQGFKVDGRRPNYYLGGAAALLLSWNKD